MSESRCGCSRGQMSGCEFCWAGPRPQGQDGAAVARKFRVDARVTTYLRNSYSEKRIDQRNGTRCAIQVSSSGLMFSLSFWST